MYVFKNHGYHEAAAEYPVSGVYRKGPDKELVWEYHGIFDREGGDFTNSISSTGQYFVEKNFRILEDNELDDPSTDQRVVLSIYDQGKIIGEFTREAFISGEFLRQNIRQYLTEISSGKRYPVPCGPRLWGHMKYDKQLDQIKIETIAKRVVTIDIPSAVILSVDKVRRMRIDGVITLNSGLKKVIRGIGLCTGRGRMYFSRKEDGLTDAPTFIAYESGEESIVDGKTYFFPDAFDVYLDQVQEMVLQGKDEHGHYPVEVQSTDGASYQWHVVSTFLICGTGEGGKNLIYRAGECKSLNITLALPEN